MLRMLLDRLRRGAHTLPYPGGPVGFPERFRGRPVLDARRCSDRCRECATRAPSAVIRVASSGTPALDLGACLFSPEEATSCDRGAIAYTREHRMASRTR